MLFTTIFSVAGLSSPAAAGTTNSGMGLAVAVMVLMGLALVYTLLSAVQLNRGAAWPIPPVWAENLIPVLAVLGLGVALYLTYVETQQVAAVCGPVGDCNAVQSSPYAKLFGVLPVGLLGAVGYVAILLAWLAGRIGRGWLAQLAPLVMFGMALFGVLFSVYLTYLELYIIHAVCIWCLSSAVIITLIMALGVGPAMLSTSDEELAPDEAGESA